MPYPAYRLNPGDMFQVDPERVLYATGAPKVDPNKIKPSKRKNKKPSASEGEEENAEVEEEAEAPAEEASEVKEAEAAEQDSETTDAPEPVKADMKPTRKQIQELAEKAKTILLEEELAVNQKRKLRGFLKQMKPLLSRAGRPDASPSEIADELSSLVSGLNLSDSPTPAPASEDAPATKPEEDPFADLSKQELEKLGRHMAEYIRDQEENPYDPSKPYKTPWQPRPFMAPFAFIPKYLEVNPNVCAAVYLRHPVARVGSAEVPTPFPREVNQLAFNWYLRRR